MPDITLPQLNANDATCVLVEWRFGDADAVPADAVVAVVETSKAIEELTTTTAGILHRLAQPGDECAFGDTIGHLFDTEQERQHFLRDRRARDETPEGTAADVVVTGPARELAAELSIDEARLRELGIAVVRRADVAALAERASTGDGAGAHPRNTRELAVPQLAVADVVTRAHQEIPAAFTVIKIRADAALAALRTAAHGSLSAMLIKAVAGMLADHPLCFATLTGQRSLTIPDQAHVAVTIDAGHGLFLPVIHAAGALPAGEIAERLAGFHRKALSRTFTEAELTGANIAVSLSSYRDVILTHPIVYPGHACMLSLGALHKEPYIDADGNLAARAYVLLGLAYDHRIVNGRDAMLFLRSVKSRLESPSTGSPSHF